MKTIELFGRKIVVAKKKQKGEGLEYLTYRPSRKPSMWLYYIEQHGDYTRMQVANNSFNFVINNQKDSYTLTVNSFDINTKVAKILKSVGFIVKKTQTGLDISFGEYKTSYKSTSSFNAIQLTREQFLIILDSCYTGTEYGLSTQVTKIKEPF